MQKILHKLIRYSRDGVNVVADINAAISTGEGGVSTSSVQSSSQIVQQNGRTWTESQQETPSEKEVKHGKDEA
jgi:hypothetical protein